MRRGVKKKQEREERKKEGKTRAEIKDLRNNLEEKEGKKQEGETSYVTQNPGREKGMKRIKLEKEKKGSR